MPVWIKALFNEIGLLLKDSLTSSNGDYDPARVFGYIPVVLGGFVFLGLAIYDTIVHAKFDYNGFAVGFSGVAIAIAGAAAGVWLKKGAEAPLPTTNAVDSAAQLQALISTINKAQSATPVAQPAAPVATKPLSVAAQKAAEKAATAKPTGGEE